MHPTVRRILLLSLLITPARSIDTPEVSVMRESVRGDTGKWNDTPGIQRIPPPSTKPANLSLDDWAEQSHDHPVPSTSGDEQWLFYRTRQLDDNDRVLFSQIERAGNNITVTFREAIWQGYYNKTFTYYEAIAVNLGLLPEGDYTLKVVIEPLVFRQFDGDGKPKANWPKDTEPGKGDPVEITLSFTISDPKE